jgi:long-chain acyl-CoA synthetase
MGYLGRPDETANAFEGSWLRSGDLAHFDELGYFYFHGRKDDLLNIGGHKFSPLEVEDCILQLSAVAEAAVVGVPFKMMDSVPKAFVVLKSGNKLNSKDIVKHCAGQIASYKVPFFVEFVESLPKNSTGKIMRKDLQNSSDDQTK